jgi:hypothetical protein
MVPGVTNGKRLLGWGEASRASLAWTDLWTALSNYLTKFFGCFTFTMTALPGTPSIQNAIPTAFFGTTTFAAPGMGIIAGTVTLLLSGLLCGPAQGGSDTG